MAFPSIIDGRAGHDAQLIEQMQKVAGFAAMAFIAGYACKVLREVYRSRQGAGHEPFGRHDVGQHKVGQRGQSLFGHTHPSVREENERNARALFAHRQNAGII